MANLLGGYPIGVAVAFFASHPSLSPQWRLLLATDFLSGLTIFSTFSVEVGTKLMETRLSGAPRNSAVHLLGSIAKTLWVSVPCGSFEQSSSEPAGAVGCLCAYPVRTLKKREK